jgi:endonuclease YncB( thermonuclease family)
MGHAGRSQGDIRSLHFWCSRHRASGSRANTLARRHMPLDCPSAYVIDGDSIRCGSERLRLLGIDAPELRCPPRRQCVAGDPRASRRSLQLGLRNGPVTYRRVTTDRYGRTVAVVWSGKVNLSCWQLGRSQARYRAKWDNGRRIALACPSRLLRL